MKKLLTALGCIIFLVSVNAMAQLNGPTPPVAPPWLVAYPMGGMEPETQNYLISLGINATTSTYNYSVNEFIKETKAHGTWAICDRIWVLGGQPSQAAAFSDLKGQNLMTAGSFPASFSSLGLTYDGATNYTNTGFVPSTNGVNYVQNSAGVHLYILNNGTSGASYQVGNTNTRVVWKNGGQTTTRINTATYTGSSLSTGTTTTGLLSVNRSGASAEQVYINGDLFSTDTVASTGVDSSQLELGGAIASTYSSGTYSFLALCGSMTALQTAQFNADVTELLQRLGVISTSQWNIANSATNNPVNANNCPPQNAGQPWSYGRFGLMHRFDDRYGDQWSGDAANTKQRDEISCTNTYATGNQTFSFEWLLFESIPSGDTFTYFIVTQLHNAGSLTPSPPFALLLTPCTGGYCWQVGSSTTSAGNTLYTGTTPIVTGHPYWIVVTVTESTTVGAISVSIDGTTIYSGTGLNVGAAGDNAYWKHGLYKDIYTKEWIARFYAPQDGAGSGSSYISTSAAPLPYPVLNY